MTLDSPAPPATIGDCDTSDGSFYMVENVDWWARTIAGASLVLSGIAVFLNWKKNARDLAAIRPQVGTRVTRVGPRKWSIHLTVMNPLQVPMAWQKVRAISPPGLQVISKKVEEENSKSPDILRWEYGDFYHVEGYPIIIAPGESVVWEGFAAIEDHYGVPRHAYPVVEPVIDGFERFPRSRILRLWRMVRQMWADASRM